LDFYIDVKSAVRKSLKMILVIDLGNTTLSLGLFKQDKLLHQWRLSTDHQRTEDEFGLQFLGLIENSGCLPEDLEGIILSSVVPPLTEWVYKACQNYLKMTPVLVNGDLTLNIKILYDNPNAVGADRIADAVAVQAKYGGPACVIDFGTATTFNALTTDAEYLGGAILPGISTAAEALVLRTAKLPPIELIAPPSVIGRNTVHAMQAGLIFGYVALVEGMVDRFRKELGPTMKVIGTGGNIHKIADQTNVFDHIDPWLTLDGLRLIWEMNHKI
jgi:type III pantothenate kinase